MGDLIGALQAWRACIGAEHVLIDQPTRTRVETATFATEQRVPAVIQPGTSEEVQACVRIANEYKTPIYPISCGKNWGHGSQVPVQDGSVVMSLARMNRIVAYDETLAYATVEPGVTFRQLHDFLRARRSRLMISPTGSTPDGSIIGNTIERGSGRGPYEEKIAHACGFEVVLPSGECIHTGFGRFAGAQTAPLHRWGVGPVVDGLFTQSNLGIVTQMTVWLAPSPKYFQFFYFRSNRDAHLEPLIDTLSALTLDGIRATFEIGNPYRILGFVRQYPWQETGGATPLPAALLERYRKQFDIRTWTGFGALFSASRAQGRAERRIIRRALGPLSDQLIFVDDRLAWLSRLIKRPFTRLTGIDLGDFIDFAYTDNPSRGIITRSSAIGMSYWRKSTPMPAEMDPDRDRCGIIWCTPTVPYTGGHVRSALRTIEQVSQAHRFEPSVGISCSRTRSVELTAAIIYDRETPGEDARAMACHDEMLRRLHEQGYFPARLGLQSMHGLPPAQDDYASFLASLKRGLDPNNILAPGRYEFGAITEVETRSEPELR